MNEFRQVRSVDYIVESGSEQRFTEFLESNDCEVLWARLESTRFNGGWSSYFWAGVNYSGSRLDVQVRPSGILWVWPEGVLGENWDPEAENSAAKCLADRLKYYKVTTLE